MTCPDSRKLRLPSGAGAFLAEPELLCDGPVLRGCGTDLLRYQEALFLTHACPFRLSETFPLVQRVQSLPTTTS